MPLFFRVNVILLLSFQLSISNADTLPDIQISELEENSPETTEPEKSTNTINRIALGRDWLGSTINNVGNRLDVFFMERFFGDEVIHGDLPGKSKAKFFIEIGGVERTGAEGDIGLDVRLTLPNTKDRLKFVASSNDDNENRITETTTETGDETDDFFTGFQYAAESILKWKPTIQLGARWSSSPETFIEGRLRRRFGPELHNIQLSQSAAYYSRRRMIYTTQINYFKLLNENWGFRFANQIRYFDRGNYYAFSHVPALQQRLSDRNAMVYQLEASGDDQNHPFIDSYKVSIRWRRRIHSSWLFFEVEPSHTYFVAPDINNDPPSEAALFFRLEVLINNE